jgi:predicted ester cyclase
MSDLETRRRAVRDVYERFMNKGGLPPGVPATHRPFSVAHVHLFRFAGDGRFLEHWAVRDDLGLARQIGLLGAGN